MKAIKCERCGEYEKADYQDVSFVFNGTTYKVGITYPWSSFSFLYDTLDLCKRCKMGLAKVVSDYLEEIDGR